MEAFKIDKEISFNYRGQKAQVVIKQDSKTSITGVLTKDYSTTERTVEEGMRKYFYKKHMSNIKEI